MSLAICRLTSCCMSSYRLLFIIFCLLPALKLALLQFTACCMLPITTLPVAACRLAESDKKANSMTDGLQAACDKRKDDKQQALNGLAIAIWKQQAESSKGVGWGGGGKMGLEWGKINILGCSWEPGYHSWSHAPLSRLLRSKGWLDTTIQIEPLWKIFTIINLPVVFIDY